MRIIAGEAKNRIIKTRKGFDTRPTLESVKESLFSIITPYIEGSVFLDLFSGSGSISLEAISRGAKRAVMIEKDGEALKYIIENIDNLGFSDRCRAYKNDVIRAIEILGRKNEKFDIIFMDPPYQDNVTKKVLKAIEQVGMLDFKDRQISELSGGQQQRTFIARALVQEADIYLMDEPFQGVDSTTEKSIVDILKKLKSDGKTLLVVHHDLQTVPTYFESVTFINKTVIATGKVKEVFTQENIDKTYRK